jgi:integrase
MLLKTKTLNNRQCPIHKRLIDAGFLDEWKACDTQLFSDAPTTPSYSIWFRDRLVKLDLWMFKKTVIHSLRGSARDLWREAGTRQEFRNAFTGHASKDVGETKYETGLKMLPDITAKELKKVNLNWLPCGFFTASVAGDKNHNPFA